jgi:zinc transport system substrate-binding protein
MANGEWRMAIGDWRMGLHLVLALVLAAGGCAGRKPANPGIVASTTLISTIIQAVAPDCFKVTTIAPAGLCPGQFDLKPSDITAANTSKLILNHGWEPWYAGLVKAILPPGPRRVTLQTPENWMVPDLQKQAVDEITRLLAETDPARAGLFKENASRYKTQVDSAGAAAKAVFAGKPLPKVIATDMQVQFLKWLGFDMVATYGRAEDFTAAELTRLAGLAQDSAVGLIVDNLQSGPDAGEPLAEALKVRHVTLTNFPLRSSYPQALADNVSALAQAIGH